MAKSLNIAHRGGADLWPENTLGAFKRAIELGVDGIELDLQLSADGHLVIYHDGRLKAEATKLNGAFLEKPTPRIGALGFKDLQTYDVGHLKAGSPYAQKRAARLQEEAAIPTLAAFDAMIAETDADFRAYSELKTDMVDADQAETLAAAYIAALDNSPAAARHIVVSFDWRTINAVRQAFPDMPHAYTTSRFSDTDPKLADADKPDSLGARLRAASRDGAAFWGGMDWRDMDGQSHGERVLRAIAAGGGKGWFADRHDITPENMALARELGLSVSAWTVNEAAEMRRLAALGVEAIITDRPDILKKL